MSGFTCDRLDLDQALLNFGDLALEETGNEARVSARKRDACAFFGAFNVDDERANAVSVTVGFAGSLFRVGKNCFEVIADLDDGDAPVARLVNDAGDDLSLLGSKVAEDLLIVCIAQARNDDRTSGRLGDTTEVLRGVVEFADRVALFVFFGGDHCDATGLLIDFDSSLRDGAGKIVVGLEKGFFNGIDEPV